MKTKLFTIAMMVALLLAAITRGQAQEYDGPCLPPTHGLDDHQSAFCGSTETQTIALSSGWNWFSTYIDMNEVNGLEMLENALGDYGVTIVTFDDQAEYLGDGFWLGLEDYHLTNGEMIMIEVNDDCTVTMVGPVVDPSTVEITLNPEWTYIGYPVTEEMLIDDAMSGFDPEFGDGIYSVNGATEYLGDWSMGEFTTLVPGQGYMYYSYSDDVKTLVFQNGRFKVKAKAVSPNKTKNEKKPILGLDDKQ